MTCRFTHPKLGEEIRAIGGGYTFTKELELDLDGRKVLAFIGVGVIDSSCCGTGGCGYALVPGYVVEFKSATDADGTPVSIIEPITDGSIRKQVTSYLKKTEYVMDVRFWSDKED